MTPAIAAFFEPASNTVSYLVHDAAMLSAPALRHQSIRVNIRAGHFPPPDANGMRYLRVPITIRTRS